MAAGLSPGAMIPALVRLLKARSILQGKSGPRRRTDHKISAEVRRYLRRAWKELIDAGPSGDLDADLRVALLALFVGDDRSLAADFLRRSAAHRLEVTCKTREPNQSGALPVLSGTRTSARPQRMLFSMENPPPRSQRREHCQGVRPPRGNGAELRPNRRIVRRVFQKARERYLSIRCSCRAFSRSVSASETDAGLLTVIHRNDAHQVVKAFGRDRPTTRAVATWE